MLLVKKEATTDYKIVSAVCSEAAAFTDALTSIKAHSEDDKNVLEVLAGLFYSNLFSYYSLTTVSSAGIEREQIHDTDEKFTFPYTFNDGTVSKVKAIEQNRKSYSDAMATAENKILDSSINRKIDELEEKFNLLLEELYSEIYRAFALSRRERALVDYAHEVSIPLINDEENIKIFNPASEKILEEYAQLFIDHFGKYFNGPDRYFRVEIYRAKYIVAVNFVVTETKPGQNISWISNKKDSEVVDLISRLGFSKVSNRIFCQKDIKGFEEHSFYIIKPNQYKLWHKAIAYLDLYEFKDAILKAGKKQFTR
jgi:hypothetical protein